MPTVCAVVSCDNRSDRKDEWIVMPHVTILRFHGCKDEKDYKKWDFAISRKDSYWHGTNASTKVCSNHFPLGAPYPDSRIPSMYMRAYPVEGEQSVRKSPKKREDPPEIKPRRKKRKVDDDECDHPQLPQDNQQEPEYVSVAEVRLENVEEEHRYTYSENVDFFSGCADCSKLVTNLIHEIHARDKCIKEMEASLNDLKDELNNLENKREKKQSNGQRITIDDLDDDSLYLHTGLMNRGVFDWLMKEVEPATENMHYYKGRSSDTLKYYQKKGTKKPGPERQLKKEDELLLTLMRLKLDLLEEYLAFTFDISVSTVSQILSTWIPLLSRELDSLLYWPSQEEVTAREAYPKCFRKYSCVRSIIDCTEVGVQKPSLAASNSQIFSNYKNKPTAKFLIACTPAGTISFISSHAGGKMSDREITEKSGILDKFSPGDQLMADRGFNIQDILLSRGVRLVIPPFTRKGKQFIRKKCSQTKTVANARIHVERVINRWKDFRILQGTIPLTCVDLLGHIGIICAALHNLWPSVVPLE